MAVNHEVAVNPPRDGELLEKDSNGNPFIASSSVRIRRQCLVA
jgi:hypothetical protein